MKPHWISYKQINSCSDSGMRKPELALTHPFLEGQRLGWVCEVLGMTRMSLGRWVNTEGIEILSPKTIPSRPSQLNRKIERLLVWARSGCTLDYRMKRAS